MHIVILDGWHRGEVIRLPNPGPTVRLLKPPVITVCDCNADFAPDEFGPTDSEMITYHVAFLSVDGDVALYSTNGKSMNFFDRFIHHYQAKPYSRTETLRFGCHDPKAWK